MISPVYSHRCTYCYNVTNLVSVSCWECIIMPREKGTLFSVCLSVRDVFFSLFVRVTPPTVYNHKQNLYHYESWVSEVSQGIRFPYPTHKKSAWLVSDNGPKSRILFFFQEHDTHTTWKPCFRSLTRPTQFVRTFNISQKWLPKMRPVTPPRWNFGSNGQVGSCALRPLVQVNISELIEIVIMQRCKSHFQVL